MAEPVPSALRCKAAGCTARRVRSGELCPKHLTEKLVRQRKVRERAAKQGHGHWAAWANDLPGAVAARKQPGSRQGVQPPAKPSTEPPAEPPAQPGGAREPAGAFAPSVASPAKGPAPREAEPPAFAANAAPAPAPSVAPDSSEEPDRNEPEETRTNRSRPDAEALRASVHRRLHEAEAREGNPTWYGVVGPGRLLESVEPMLRWLPPGLAGDAWRVVDAAGKQGLLDPDGIASAARNPLGALGRLASELRGTASDAGDAAANTNRGAERGPTGRREPGPRTDTAQAPDPEAGQDAARGDRSSGGRTGGLFGLAGRLAAEILETTAQAWGPASPHVDPEAGAATAERPDSGDSAARTFARLSRAFADAAQEAKPAVQRVLSGAGEVGVEAFRLGLGTLGKAIEGGLEPALRTGLSQAAKLGRTAAHDLLRPFVPGLGFSERLRRARTAAGRVRSWWGRLRRGEIQTDAYGLDREMLEIASPPLGLLARGYFRLQVQGLRHLPADGPALVVANRAGLFPLAELLLATALGPKRHGRRPLRVVGPRWLFRGPVGSRLLPRLGLVPEREGLVRELLGDGHLVVAFPEGVEGFRKSYARRGEVLPFAEESPFRAAIDAGAPVIPCALDGLERGQPGFLVFSLPGRLLGLPALPITPTFPWLGPLGLLPLPTRHGVRFGEALPANGSVLRPPEEAAQHLAEEAHERVAALLRELRG